MIPGKYRCVQLKSERFREIPGKYRCVQLESEEFRVIPGKYSCVCSSRVKDSE